MKTLTAQERQLVIDSGLFDAEWYLATYRDVASVGLKPLEHYLRIGIYAGRNPCRLFDSHYYLSQFPDNAPRPEIPLVDYLQDGWRLRRNPHPLFQIAWYLERNEDIVAAGIEPLGHFFRHGGLEGRQPSPGFPTHRVLERCPQLRENGRNPLDFYLSREWAEDPCPEATAFFSLHQATEPATSRISIPTGTGLGQASPPIPKHPLPAAGPVSTDIRAIAIYLPQFHAIPENDAWWGKGFTEWTNVRRATPQYAGHYQPHVPHPDLGYYDLNDPSVLEKQAVMARAAGIEGFCFYYYWFNGRRLLHMPTDRLLATGKPDFPFCFCWANENWTRTWDGGDKEVLIGQDHSYESDERFILDLLPAFRDPRYIRVKGKPLLIVYRPGLLPDPAASARHWRETCRREGIGEVFLAFMLGFESPNPSTIDFDAAIQMPPLRCGVPVINSQVDLLDPVSFSGEVRDYRQAAALLPYEDFGRSLWPGVFPSWDNTARRMERAHSWIHSSPEAYHKWLSIVVQRARTTLPPGERFVFINAWNEWAEGCHLEPDEKYGYAWLNATRLALTAGVPQEKSRSRRRTRVLVIGHDAARAGAQAVLLALLKEWKAPAICDFQLILLGDGVLRSDFEALCPTLVLSDHAEEPARLKALEAFCRLRPDVILSNTVVCGPFLPHLKHLGAPIVTYVHELQKSIERWASGPIMQATVKNSDHLIAVSEPVAENLRHTHGIPAKRISTLNPYIKTSHRVSPEGLQILRAELGIQPHEKIVFGCGTVDWRKGPDLFVETALEVLKKVPEARFFWMGGDTGDEASARARRLATDSRIRFLGERENPRDYLALGHAFFLSSREDPFPLVALEAADAGLPVVCFADAGGMPEFVGNTCGRTVPYEDTNAAAEALVGFLKQETLRQNTGLMAQATVRAKHDAARGSAAVLSILEELLPAHKKSAHPRIAPIPAPKRPLVSVIVPNYNHERFLPRRLESISLQTLTDFEIILLDDCSTDGSRKVMEEFAAREPRARLLLNSENSGSTFKQWRKGFAQAKGKYIWIAESDDDAHSDFLSTLVARLEANSNAVLATCCPQMTNIEGSNLGIPNDWFADIGGDLWKTDFSLSGQRVISEALVYKNAILNASGVIFRNHSGLEDLVDQSMRLCADWLFWIRLLATGDFEYVARPLNYWRLNSSNARTKPPGELEWIEGARIVREACRILSLDDASVNQLLKSFHHRCEAWKNRREEEAAEGDTDACIKSKKNKPTQTKDGNEFFKHESGYCPICEKEATFSAKHSWLRDHYLCSGCGSIPRERAIMHVLQTRYPNWRDLRIHESSPGNRGTSVKLATECKNYTASQYDPDLGFGNTHPSRGYRSENLEKQTFPDESFDIVVTQDVMEHIFDAEAAFRDIHRTLKPGGAHIFTTPLVNKKKPTQRRAELRPDGTVHHLFPPEYHGNPMSSEGSLVTFHWGFDIADFIEKSTAEPAELIHPTDARMGIEAEYIEVVIQKRQKATVKVDTEKCTKELLEKISEYLSDEKHDKAIELLKTSKFLSENEKKEIKLDISRKFLFKKQLEWTNHGITRTFRFFNKNEKVSYLSGATELINVLKRRDYHVSLGFGAVLGFIRESDFIPHDDDIDLIVGVDKINLFDAKNIVVEFLEEYGYRNFCNNFSHLTVCKKNSNMKRGIDIFIGIIEDGYFSCFPSRRKVLRFDDVFPAEDQIFFETSLPFPKNPQAYLEAVYGSDWRNPISHWNHPWDLKEYEEFLK